MGYDADTAENGFCSINCGSIRSLRDDCRNNPCLGMDNICTLAPHNVTLSGSETCEKWCCPLDTAKLVGCLIGAVLFLICVVTICCVCCKRRRKRRGEQIVVQHEGEIVMPPAPGSPGPGPVQIQSQNVYVVTPQPSYAPAAGGYHPAAGVIIQHHQHDPTTSPPPSVYGNNSSVYDPKKVDTQA